MNCATIINGDVRRPRVYVAGPYTRPDPCENTRRAIDVGNALWDRGYAPFIPHLSHFWHTVTPRPYSMWTEYDLQFLPVCDALLRMPGESPGSDGEVEMAKRLGIPVFDSIEVLDAFFKGPA